MWQMPQRQSIATREPPVRSGYQLRAVRAQRQAAERAPPGAAARVRPVCRRRVIPKLSPARVAPRAGCIGPRRPVQLALAKVLAGTAVGHAEARSNRVAVTTSRRSRMPTNLAIVSSALQSAELR